MSFKDMATIISYSSAKFDFKAGYISNQTPLINHYSSDFEKYKLKPSTAEVGGEDVEGYFRRRIP
jgi:hypothetical protein